MNNTIEADEETRVQEIVQQSPYTSQMEVYYAILAAITKNGPFSDESRKYSAFLRKMWNQTEEFPQEVSQGRDVYAAADVMVWLDQNASFRIHGRSLVEWTEDTDEQEDVIPEEEEVAQIRELQIHLATNSFGR